MTFAPQGAYGTVNGQSVFTHGVEIGIARNEIARSADRDRRAHAIAGAAATRVCSRASGSRPRDRSPISAACGPCCGIDRK